MELQMSYAFGRKFDVSFGKVEQQVQARMGRVLAAL